MMEFGGKLQMLRKQSGLTQEEVAQALYVSRAAVSKWESGRGYPGIDSLKAIASFYSVTIDSLLSGDEALALAQEEHAKKEERLRERVFALLDLSAVLLFVLPLFGQTAQEGIESVSLLALTGAAPYLRAAYFAAVAVIAASGAAALLSHGCGLSRWRQGKTGISLMLNAAGALLFVIGRQPYAATLLLGFLAIKAFLFLKKR